MISLRASRGPTSLYWQSSFRIVPLEDRDLASVATDNRVFRCMPTIQKSESDSSEIRKSCFSIFPNDSHFGSYTTLSGKLLGSRRNDRPIHDTWERIKVMMTDYVVKYLVLVMESASSARAYMPSLPATSHSVSSLRLRRNHNEHRHNPRLH